jgi:hypothetical protein
MIDILGLLKRIEFKGNFDGWPNCPECQEDTDRHKPGCQLKAAIDALESGRLVVVEKPE